MSILGITCPFCKQTLSMDIYKMKKDKMPTICVYCDNEECEVQPCSDATNPSAAFADVEAWR